MTNKMSIEKEKSRLVAEGVINIKEDINTKNIWKSKGYEVNKDEIPVTQIPLFVYAPRYVIDKNGKPIYKKMMLVLSNLYTQSQVTKLKKGA